MKPIRGLLIFIFILFNYNNIFGQSVWTAQTSGTNNALLDVHFTNPDNGWAVGAYGTILHTTDGGANWSAQTSGTGNHLRGVHFTDDNNGWAVGFYEKILNTTDGGTNWSTQNSGTSGDLWGVHFTDANNGWAVGYYGTILYTSNGGTNWTAQTSGTANVLYGVYFTDSDTGWAVGENGTIRHTSNGGANWSTQTSGTINTLYGIHFTDSNNGWAVGFNGTILHTSNGGASWNPQNSGTTWDLRGVHFTDSNNCWAVGLFGTIRHTTNGGTNWSTQTSGTTEWLYGVHFTDFYHGWAVGSGGTILKSPNYPPVLSPIGDKSVNENQALTIILSAANEDGDSLSYSVTNNPTGSSLTDSVFTWTPDYTQQGSYSVTFTASDYIDSDSDTITITVNDVNRAPSITSTGITFAFATVQYEYDVDAEDPDLDILTYSLTTSPAGMNIDSSTGLITWTPTKSQIDSHNVTVEVTDGDLKDTQSFIIAVSEYNRLPVLNIIGERVVDEGRNLTLTLSGTDADGDTLTYSVFNNPPGSSLEGNIFTWKPAYDQSGNYSVKFRASDGKGYVDVTVGITVNNVNFRPSFTSSPITVITEGEPYSYNVEVYDFDEDELTFSLLTSPDNMTIDAATGLIEWAPVNADIGEHDVAVQVSDGELTNTQSFKIRVKRINFAPVLSSINDTTISETQTLTIKVSAEDIDGDTLTFGLIDNPSGSSVEGDTFSWTPTYEQSGEYMIIFAVYDGYEGADSVTVKITVNDLNRPPVFAPSRDTTFAVDVRSTYYFIVTDPDGDKLYVIMDKGPMGTLNDNEKLIWKPPVLGEFEVSLIASDNRGGLDTCSFIITVIEAPVSVDESEKSPEEFVLKQNYPNPFNPHTVIEYEIPKITNVTLQIYNPLGKEIITLIDEVQHPGSYSVIWDGMDDLGNKVNSGIYLYKLKAGRYISTKKMILIK